MSVIFIKEESISKWLNSHDIIVLSAAENANWVRQYLEAAHGIKSQLKIMNGKTCLLLGGASDVWSGEVALRELFRILQNEVVISYTIQRAKANALAVRSIAY